MLLDSRIWRLLHHVMREGSSQRKAEGIRTPRRQLQQLTSNESAREGVDSGSTVVRFHLGGADWANCLKYIILVMDRLPDVRLTLMDYASATATVTGTFDITPPDAVARYISRCTGFDVTVLKEGADDPLQAVVLPVRFACGIPSKHLLDTLGITATPIRQHISLSWPRKMLMGHAETTFHELRISISDDQQKARDVLKKFKATSLSDLQKANAAEYCRTNS